MPELARMEGVTKRHAGAGATVTALAHVTLEVREGELLAVVGRAGSGKTSLLFALGGIETPDEGRVAVSGIAISELPAQALTAFRRKTTGWMFQEAALVPSNTALENIVLSLRLAGVSASLAQTRAFAALEAVELTARAHHHPHQLSGGEQQRVDRANHRWPAQTRRKRCDHRRPGDTRPRSRCGRGSAADDGQRTARKLGPQES